MPGPLLPPRDLTVPEPGSTTARDVLSRATGRVLEELRRVPRRAPRDARAEASALEALLRGVLVSAPGALVSAVRRPTVGGLVRCLRPDGFRTELLVELVADLAFALALAGALPEPLRLSRSPGRILSIPARLSIAMPSSTRAVSFENGRVTVEHETGTASIDLEAPVSSGPVVVAHPYEPIAGDLVLALADNNPLSLLEAHPDKSGNALDLGGHGAPEWTSALADALAPIDRHLPDLRREMDLFVSQIVPVGWDPEKHLSASYQEIIGTIYMTLHPSRMTLAEALIHEFSHNKLNALFEIDDVLENAWSPLYTSPVRPDPRPLHGVLLAVHAFLPVARLYERMIESGDPAAQREDFRGRFAAIRRINREGAELLLAEGRPTPIGQGLFDEIRRWHEHYLAAPATS